MSSDGWIQVGAAGAAGGEAQGFFVRASSADGYAKDSGGAFRAAHEKIAADLAHELRLPIPPVVLWTAGGHSRSISRVPFSNAFTWDQASQATSNLAQMLPDLSRAASAMIAFDSWVENTDRLNGGNLIVTRALRRGFGCAYIDYAYSQSCTWGDAGVHASCSRVGPYPASITLDGGVISEAVRAIEALPQPVVEEIVRRIPDPFMNNQRRETILACLVARQSQLRGSLGL